MTYKIVKIGNQSKSANGTKSYSGMIRIQQKHYRFILWNTEGPQITAGSILLLEDDKNGTLDATLGKEFDENPQHPSFGREQIIANHKFRTRVELAPVKI